MGLPQKQTGTPASVVDAVNEIMSMYRSLPPRPTIEEVEAAVAIIQTSNAEQESKLQQISSLQKPPDVPDELFDVLQEARRNCAMVQAHEQRKEAQSVIDLDMGYRVFDELIQRASKLVSGGATDEEDEKMMVVSEFENNKKKKIEDEDKRAVSSLKTADVPQAQGDESDKLSLIKVASLIETTAKDGSGVLDLRGKLMDQIEWLPLSLGKLQDVTELDLSENRIMALPSTISSMKFLTKLDVHSNQLINLPESFGGLTSLVDLDLHANRMKSLPASFGNLTSLVDLDLSSNQLAVLPDALGNLTNLRRLNLETNELEELPYTIGSCTSLVELRVDFNQLKALPEAIGKLESLEILTLHYNRIKSLPTTMGSLSKLKELDVSFNELGSIPESLCFCTNLVKLDVGRNFADLRSLPGSIGNLEMLEELDISSNQIRELPDSFRFLSKLRALNTDETPLEVPPRQIAKLGAQAVVEYMADLVAARGSRSQSSKRRKGIWYWVCSLFRPHKKDANSRIGFADV